MDEEGLVEAIEHPDRSFVIGIQWHPEDKNIILTSGLDGALRVWDLSGEALFGHLMNKHVLQIRSKTGQMRVGASSCCFTKDGTL